MKKYILILLLSLTAMSNSILPRLSGSQKVAVGILSGMAGISAVKGSWSNWSWTLTNGNNAEPRGTTNRGPQDHRYDYAYWRSRDSRSTVLNNMQHVANGAGIGVVTAASLVRLIRR